MNMTVRDIRITESSLATTACTLSGDQRKASHSRRSQCLRRRQRLTQRQAMTLDSSMGTGPKQLSNEQQILKLFEDGDRAIIAADVAELSRIYTDDYTQYDENGRLLTKEDLLDTAKTGTTRYLSMTSTGRNVRLLNAEFAIVNGSEEDEVEQAGRRFTVRYVYMDVVVKRNNRWQIVSSQLARPA